MKRLLIVLLIALISVGCSNKNSQQSSQTSPVSSLTSEKYLTIEDVEGYWECKSEEEGILLKLGWKNDIDLYYSDGSKEKNSYNIIDSDSNSIEIEMRDEDNITNIFIKSNLFNQIRFKYFSPNTPHSSYAFVVFLFVVFSV